LLLADTAHYILPAAYFSTYYQELFVTPVTSPSSASFLKHNRHMWNFRMNARGRPHSLQRLR